MPSGKAPAAGSWLDRTLSRFGLQRAVAPAPSRGGAPSRRVHHAADINRLTADLFAQTLSANDELKGDIRRLRGLSRRLFRDTAIGARYPKLVAEQTLGADGIRLQCRIETRVGGLNKGINRQTEDAWRRWGMAGTCTVDGRLSFLASLYALTETLAVDGEALVREIRGYPNEFGYAVQLLDADLLDEQFTGRHTNGNEVIMGVEVDGYQRPVAYHLWTRHPSEFVGGRERVRVPANEIRHLFLANRVQTRGAPWAGPILLDAGTFGAFLEAAVHAARVGASRVAAIETASDAPGDEDTEYTDVPDEVGPAEVWKLRPGETLNSTNWQYPTGEMDPFSRVLLRNIATGWNVSYSSLTGDLSQANYGSERKGMLTEREFFRRVQRLLIDGYCWPVYRSWREMAVIAGQLPARANMRDYDKVVWQVRGYPWIDPLKDIQAQTMALDACLTTRRRILGEQGMDLEEVFEGLAEENQLMKDLGITPTTGKTVAAAEPDADDANGTNDKGTGTDAGAGRSLTRVA